MDNKIKRADDLWPLARLVYMQYCKRNADALAISPGPPTHFHVCDLLYISTPESAHRQAGGQFHPELFPV